VALRDFVDSRNVEWRIWDVTPERMHPLTAREMFHGEYADFQEGWLVFECATERRRLAPFPGRWESMSMEQLEELLARAVRVRTSGESRAGGETRASTFRRIEEERIRREEEERSARAADAGLADSTPEPVVPPWRTFTGPSGRQWTAGEVERDDPSLPDAERRALRFTSDDGASCELAPFPDDWARHPRERLYDLLNRATPTADGPPDKGSPRRRRQDFRP
jgi:hypothetical protein